MTSDTQKLLLQTWARDISHVVTDGTPKAEFARLAKAKGWVGGDEQWCRHWKMCFLEVYPYGKYRPQASTPTVKMSSPESDTEDLAEDMRALAVVSRTSSYSLISSASDDSFASVRSLGSECSGPMTTSEQPENLPNTKISSRRNSLHSVISFSTVLSNDTVQSLEEFSGVEAGVEYGGVALDPESGAQTFDLCIREKTGTSNRPASPSLNPAWYGWANFKPNPAATFKNDFQRLALIQGWSQEMKREQLIHLLSSEVTFHWDTDSDKLMQWKQLCKDMGIEDNLTTVTQCKKALKPLKVNLYSVIDHKRNSSHQIITYTSRKALRKSVRKFGTFPRQCAKAGGGFMAPLLSVL